MAEKFTLKRGLSNIYGAFVTKDNNETDGGYTAGTPFHLIPAGELSIAVDAEKANVWFDNAVFAALGREGNSEMEITGASLREKIKAELNGKYVDPATGIILDDGGYHETYLAIGGTMHNLDGTTVNFWFLKGTVTPFDEAGKTEDESTDYNGDTIKYSAQKTIHKFDYPDNTKKPCKRVIMDSSTTKLVDSQSWEAQVVTPENLATICAKITETA